MFLLDTNIVIRVLRGAAPVLAARMLRHEGELAVSAITGFELMVGAQKRLLAGRSDESERVAAFLALMPVLPFDMAAGAEAAKLRAMLERDGIGIGAADTLIAGHALALGAVLVTNNTREFDRVAGLAGLEDWTQG
jgi:tRNA(fMet)-specific endonuclease VapC